MQKCLLVIGVALGLSPASLGCAQAQTPKCDVATNDGVRALYQKLTSNELSKDHECIERSTTFPGLIRVGHFRHDYGCRWGEVLLNCQIDPPNAGAQVLTKAGWAKADAAQREKLAIAWLLEGEGADVLQSPAHRWPKDKTFTPPRSTPAANGGLVLRYWIEGRVGRRPIVTHTLMETTFAADGSHGPAKEIESVEINLKGN